MALVVASLILVGGFKWHWWTHRKNRRLLRLKELTFGTNGRLGAMKTIIKI
jgi:hypothetical protein